MDKVQKLSSNERVFLISALVAGEWSASRPGCFNSEKEDRRMGGPQNRFRRRRNERKKMINWEIIIDQ
jgi:hypothetical protein